MSAATKEKTELGWQLMRSDEGHMHETSAFEPCIDFELINIICI